VSQPSGPIIEQTATRVAYETVHIRLREDAIRRPDGSAGIYSYLEKPDFALIIPVEDDGFHLVEQYRYPVRMRCWEFPQGTFPDMAPTDDPEKLAAEELRQETGLTASELHHLGHLHCAHGLSSQGFDVFVARGLAHGTPDLEIEEQDLRSQWFPRGEVEAMIRRGDLTDDCSLAAYTLFLLAGETAR
jgi:8-oxo-dGTP pyrophosphatase MutT (NUDIX family)